MGREVASGANLFAPQKYGNIHSRIGNPTVAAFEERLASLEGAIGGVATSSGQAVFRKHDDFPGVAP
ncbi:O-acetylhomoserine (thiol)-lyase [Amycolatopsis decaplanina DSM 44594]|uniref:O-acetylhomoserine (Thiol)-lyase n=1 Tax=Amycolatopsis decaplanina DSM 44594 TaxID=1284240 RepID=M2Z4G6_9PSEU|nr:O-acetylhomoserine (thiol)-lyase [Amycolatopsis decaplanina DSM 44594]